MKGESDGETAFPCTVRASAPGKLILFGEHAVVHGQPAICASLSDLRIHVSVSLRNDGMLHIAMPDLDVNAPIHFVGSAKEICFPTTNSQSHSVGALARASTRAIDDIDVDGIAQLLKRNGVQSQFELTALCPVVYLLNELVGILMTDDRGVMIRVHSDNLPVGAGLGSSAAFSVALSAALFKIHSFLLLEEGWNQPVPAPDSKPSQWFGSPPSSALDVINSYAFLAETLIHGNPSGIDNTISCFGGVICYTKNVEAGHVTTEAISDFPPLSILVTNTGVPRSTKKLVSEVGKFSEKYPELARGIFDAIGGISRHFRIMLNRVRESSQPFCSLDHKELAFLIRTNQNLLRTLGVSHILLDEICTISERYGVASKLTGAGGGGCAVTYLEDSSLEKGNEIKIAIEASQSGFQCLSSSLGGPGVLWTEYATDEYKTKRDVAGS